MSSKLDRSLDEILAERPRGGSARRQNRGGNAAATGGIRKRSQRVAAQKATGAISQGGSKTAAAGKPVPTGPSNKATGSKIIVSNLPYDVSEAMIKEYFTKVVGPIKRCVITYGPNGMSRGIATVEFQRSQDAALAAQKYNGVEVDKRPMRVELVVDPATPSFADRIGAPKAVPTASKSASNKPKPVAKSTRGQQETRGARGKARGRGGRAASGRAKPKTTEELDAEMADYFEGGSGAAPPAGATNGATVPAPAAANVDMDDDEVL